MSPVSPPTPSSRLRFVWWPRTHRPRPTLGAVGLPAAALLLAGSLVFSTPGQAQGLAGCPAVERNQDGGPWDYRTRPPRLATVESFHYTPRVEHLLRGASSENPSRDLEFVFRYFPNHHRALVTLVRLAERDRTTMLKGAKLSVECHFDRALRFTPDDAIVRMLYAQFLLKQDRADEAMRHLEIVRVEKPDDAFTQYNLGLIYLDAGRFAEALTQAHRAMELGFPRPDLKDRLLQAGQWQEPTGSPGR